MAGLAEQLLARYDAIAITGPTAGGKSALAMQLAGQMPCEIISMDSAQVFTGMNIGTAKPSAAERSAVPHHLIDVRDPADAYNAADFARDTAALLPQIKARSRVPLIVGGTMLYLKALLEGLSDLPKADAAVRELLNAEGERDGWPALHARLAQLDPPTGARLKPNDKQRIQRALEVIELTGKPLSSHFMGSDHAAPRVLHLSVEPERALRWQRIEQRFDAMLESGLIEEVRGLKARPDLHLNLPSMRCVGYRQVWQFLDGQSDEKTMRDQAVFATRQLSKRQMTWLRSMPERHIVASLPEALQVIGND
jgi:tRNA dimethylallyltransferase